MSRRLWENYISDTGEPVRLTEVEMQHIMTASAGQNDQDSRNPDSKHPSTLEEEHIALMEEEILAPGGPAQVADDTEVAQVGLIQGGWESASSADQDVHNSLGTFSMAFNTAYTVHPKDPETGLHRVEWERTVYIYDWYNFSDEFPDTQTDEAAKLERDGLAKPFRVTGSYTFTGPDLYI